MSKIVVTYTPCFRKNMIREIVSVDKNVKILDVLSDSVLIFNSDLSFDDFASKLIERKPIFVKHLMPIMKCGFIDEKYDEDKYKILNDVSEIALFDEDKRFSVQCRIIKGGYSGLSYSSKDMEVFIGETYEKMGLIPVFSDNMLINENIKIISILINKGRYYVGFSTSIQNFNFHCDEYRICSKNGRQVSRAENKLKEALIKFDIKLNNKGYALDIGAAPGGWTKVLVDNGFVVYAVDPGNLKPELEENVNVRHYKCRIEDLNFTDFFEIIVNDMNVEPSVTAEIMNKLSTSLQDNGVVIITLKLPDKVEEDIKKAVLILNQCYDILSIKTLFHNRQEVTVFARKKTFIKDKDIDKKDEKRKILKKGNK